MVEVLKVQPAHQCMVVAKAALQRPRQIRNLGPHPPLGQIGQHRRAAFPVDQRLHHRPRRLGGELGCHRVDLDAGVLEHVAEALQLLVRDSVSLVR